MAKVTKRCFSCGKDTCVEINGEKLNLYNQGGHSIQEIFPKEHAMVREFLINGMCFDCQSKMYNSPKPNEDWGEVAGYCPNCGCNLWRKDRNSEGGFSCPSCYQIWGNSELEWE